ncbi:hypothetical protein [Symbiobacterium thermophilum]|uniref:NurA domain-containing protein n=1 Tax=Symbiobacterium thermophilum (strain DSM 24528 / JCM 14929 / IAM 14863 / T) TaxID=292459 RepID=Q67M50_SYMTH|nr:hypothetical protein [Symbiobacterium thermophilum]BAD41245.1 hypothetical protein STH2260 [Symbiobacterium thermophilum IAM 14863]
MLHPDALTGIKEQIIRLAEADRALLDDLRREVRDLAGSVRVIRPRSSTAISLVASDGGNNKLVFDPFYVQVVRVVDSYGKELLVDVVSPTTDPDSLLTNHFTPSGDPKSALGRLMADLGVRSLSALSHMIPDSRRVRERPETVSPSWVQVYRDICEWAVLYERICYQTFASDTLIVRDGLLRSKVFRGEGFIRMRERMEEAIERVWRQDRRRIYLVGLAKHSQVLNRYGLAMAIEETLPAGDARYVAIPRELEAKAYKWQEWARGAETEEGEAPKFVAGDMFFVRFGPHSGDPVWAVDIFSAQRDRADEILGHLLADARDGFPVPYYPRCLQRAHEHAQLADFDWAILQDQILDAVRGLLPREKQFLLDAYRLRADVTGERYG